MFDPKFTCTNNLINYIAEISAIRQSILDSKIKPSYDLFLKNTAMINSCHNSTSIEGNPLTIEEVKKLFEGEELNAPIKSKREVLNYFDVLKNLENYETINKETILDIHKKISKDTLKNKEFEGKYRESSVIIGNVLTGEVNFTPPAPYKVPYLIDEFIDWFNQNQTIYPVILAGIAHYELVRIHPFVDGNGRTARAIAALILRINGFDINGYFALDEFYNLNRLDYENALKSADKSQDLTEWLEYFTYGVLNSIKKVKREIDNLPKFTHTIELNEKEIAILNFINENKEITNRDVSELFNVSSQSAYNYLKSLKDKKIIKSIGSGRSIKYVLKI